jgi:hypothetical protein
LSRSISWKKKDSIARRSATRSGEYSLTENRAGSRARRLPPRRRVGLHSDGLHDDRASTRRSGRRRSRQRAAHRGRATPTAKPSGGPRPNSSRSRSTSRSSTRRSRGLRDASAIVATRPTLSRRTPSATLLHPPCRRATPAPEGGSRTARRTSHEGDARPVARLRPLTRRGGRPRTPRRTPARR